MVKGRASLRGTRLSTQDFSLASRDLAPPKNEGGAILVRGVRARARERPPVGMLAAP